MRRNVASRTRLSIACTLLSASMATAQGRPPGTVTPSLAVTGVHQFDADLDEGGSVGWGADFTGKTLLAVLGQLVARHRDAPTGQGHTGRRDGGARGETAFSR